MSSRHNVFFYLIALFLVLTAAASYYRFIVLSDFMVSYEVDCSPYNSSCFVGCEDDGCESEYYYKLITRQASEIEGLCGQDITDCEAAQSCQATALDCSVSFCSPDIRDCDRINEEGATEDNGNTI